jgi:hypothetical protein
MGNVAHHYERRQPPGRRLVQRTRIVRPSLNCDTNIFSRKIAFEIAPPDGNVSNTSLFIRRGSKRFTTMTTPPTKRTIGIRRLVHLHLQKGERERQQARNRNGYHQSVADDNQSRLRLRRKGGAFYPGNLHVFV